LYWCMRGLVPQANAEIDPHRSFYLDLLHQWVDVSGHPTPMPFWTTGFIQCKDRYRNQSQVLDGACTTALRIWQARA
jgi:alpha-glucosidase (family GH31 glycosyl hydrolase)